ncbi:hypothetical protein [uncultured Ruegeria sp.]|uniref:hypothetical protein n=1 Tax=uncultured Ruegeria sp. TaxID=259304 RepID=UPI002606845B|nr:hypothetical protein [uncultured Ruegeria sp.]
MSRTRQPLPDRRLAETRRVETPQGHTAFISVGYQPSSPLKPREVFYCEGFKSGSDLEYHMQDMCVLISLLLQFDMTPSDIARSLSRRKTEMGEVAYASLVGWVLEAVCQPPQWADQVTLAGDPPEQEGRANET